MWEEERIKSERELHRYPGGVLWVMIWELGQFYSFIAIEHASFCCLFFLF